MRVRGANSRRFFFERQLRTTGAEVREARRRLGRRMKLAVEAVTEAGEAEAWQLIAVAKEVRGSLLLLDAERAEAALWRRQAVKQAVALLQRVYRGHRARVAVTHLRRLRAMEHAERRVREVTAASLARALLSRWVTVSAEVVAACVRRPDVVVTRRTDGITLRIALKKCVSLVLAAPLVHPCVAAHVRLICARLCIARRMMTTFAAPPLAPTASPAIAARRTTHVMRRRGSSGSVTTWWRERWRQRHLCAPASASCRPKGW